MVLREMKNLNKGVYIIYVTPMKREIFLRNMSHVYLYLTGRILYQYYEYR